MPLILVTSILAIENTPLIPLPNDLIRRYPIINKIMSKKSKLLISAVIEKIYNNTNGRLVYELLQLEELPVIYQEVRDYEFSKIYSYYFIDFTHYHIKHGIPVGNIVQSLLMSFKYEDEGGTKEVAIFPGELRVFVDPNAPPMVKSKVEIDKASIEQVERNMVTIALLQSVGLNDVANDLLEGLLRYYMNDFEGSIKFFRKVLESIRQLLNTIDIVQLSEKRKDFLKQYVGKAYQLVSNFGEHAGTRGSKPEADLSKDITLSISTYIATYLYESKR